MSRLSEIGLHHKMVSNVRFVQWFFAVFYLVGIGGMLYSETFPLFKKLIPLAIILTIGALFSFHGKWNKRQIILFIFIYLLGFTVEAIGTNTGKIFGNYSYGSSLGLTLFKTPLIIGLNWLLLVYLTSAVVSNIKSFAPVKVIVASALMVTYDVILEPVAPALNMWNWKNNYAPIQNYIAWFFLAILFHSLLILFEIKIVNRLAFVLFLYQFVFFSTLLIALT